MKANELMQGDIVLYEYNGEKIHARVVEVYRSSALVESVSKEYEPIEIAEDKLFPIPLTPEILEKNGFKYTNNHTLQGSDTYILRYEQNGFDYTITYKLNDWFAVDSYDDRTYRIFEMETGRWCVHQLQHALRLCGINKEIVL